MEKNQLFLSGRKGKALGLNPPVACGDSPPSSGALGISQSLTSLPRPPLVGNNDDRRQWRKQGGVVGAAASRTRVLCTMWTLGAATRTGGIPQGMTVGFNLPRAITPRRGGACSASGPHHQWQRWPALQCKVHCPAQRPCRGNQDWCSGRLQSRQYY